MIIDGIRINHDGDGRMIGAVATVVFNPFADVSVMRVTPQGKPLGGVIISNWTGYGGSVCIHVAGFEPNWLSRNLLFVAFDYPFRQLGVKKIFAQMKATNMVAINFNRRLGFEPKYLIEGAYPGDDMLVTELTPETCRYLSLQPRLKDSADG
jgi:RimJ/RimL family protein N-acetyltransferase